MTTANNVYRYFTLLHMLSKEMQETELESVPFNVEWNGNDGRLLVSDLRDKVNRILPKDQIINYGTDTIGNDLIIVETIPDPDSIQCEPMEADAEAETVPDGWQSVEGGTETDHETEFKSRMERFEMTLE